MKESFGSRVAWGVAWTLFGRGSSLVMNMVVGITVTRILSPDAIGLATIATVCAGFAEVFAQIGLLPAIVQREEVEPRHLNTAFWTDNAIGAVWGVGFAALAPVVVAIYDDPRLLPLLLALATMFPLAAIGKVHRAQMQRAMEFRQLARIDVISSLLVGGIAIAAVLLGAGVWAIILRVVLTRAMTSVLTWYATGWLPRWLYDREALRELFDFSGRLFAAEVIAYLARSLDRLVMGRAFGTETLGYYSRASGLVVQPLGNLTQVLASVLFPSLSRIQNDIPRVRSVYVRMLGSVALVSFPMAVGLVVLSDDLVAVVLGESWLPAGQYVRILASLLLWQALMNMNKTVFKALGRADVLLKVTVSTRLLIIVSTLSGLPWGPVGMAWGYLIGSGAATMIAEALAGRLIELKWRSLAKPLGQVAVCAALLGVGLYGALDWAWSAHVARPLRILLGLGVGATLYPLALALVRPEPLRDLLDFVRRWRERRRGAATDADE